MGMVNWFGPCFRQLSTSGPQIRKQALAGDLTSSRTPSFSKARPETTRLQMDTWGRGNPN